MADEQRSQLIDYVSELFCIEIDYALDKSVHMANRQIRSEISSSSQSNDDAHVFQILLQCARLSIIDCLSAENVEKIKRKALHPSPVKNYIQTTEITLATALLNPKYHGPVDHMLQSIFCQYQNTIFQAKQSAIQQLKDAIIPSHLQYVQVLVTHMHACCTAAILDEDMLMEGMRNFLVQQATQLQHIAQTNEAVYQVQPNINQEAGTSFQSNNSNSFPANSFEDHSLLPENCAITRSGIDQFFEDRTTMPQDDDSMISLTVSDDEEEDISTSAFHIQPLSPTCITNSVTPATEITPKLPFQAENELQSGIAETDVQNEEEEVDMLEDNQDDEESQDTDEDVPLSELSSKDTANSSFSTTKWKNLLPTPAFSFSSNDSSLLSVNEILNRGYCLVKQAWKAGDDRLISSLIALERKKIVELLQKGLNDKASNFLHKYANGLPITDHDLEQIALLGSKKCWRSVVMTVFQKKESSSPERTSSQVHNTMHSAYIAKCAHRPKLMVNTLRGSAKTSYYFYSHLSSDDGFGNPSLKAMSVPLWTCEKKLDVCGILKKNEVLSRRDRDLAKLAFVRLAKSVLIFCFWTLQNDAAISKKIRLAFPKAIPFIRGLNYSASLGSCGETYGLVTRKSKSANKPNLALPTSTLPATPSIQQSMASMITTWMGSTAHSLLTLSGEEEKKYLKSLRQLSSEGIVTAVFPLRDEGPLRACINFANNRNLSLDFYPDWLQGKCVRSGGEVLIKIMLRKGTTFTEDGKGKDATVMVYAMKANTVVGYPFKTKTSTSISAQILQDAVEVRRRDKRRT